MKVSVGISNRHVHLSKEDLELLFGTNPLTKKGDLKQPGMFACNEVVTIKGPKNSIEKVRILGPCRDYTQVEVSRTDAFKLGLNPPVRDSGDLEGSEEITIIGPNGEITRNACIIATRHIHVNKEIREKYHLENVHQVKIKADTIKPGILENVYLKDTDEAFFELHLDMDDANCLFLKNDDEVEIIL